ncbi:E3 ubiquitin-protein ligase RING1-like [Hibiscus syriacus]|uniref:E3 ubiquitin-protein ligase RING1-like n=1 Tax=Hibiscus syriacus TaxID=106335 RepID=UPI0019225A7C|nr:E3 ubiquitin-protein ligase RING1-like [Hibiscus syriacus]
MGFLLRKTLSEDCDDLDCYQICTSSSSSATSKCFRLCSQHCDHGNDVVFPPPTTSHHSKFPTKYLISTLTIVSFSFLILCLYVYIIRRHRRRSGGVTGRSDLERETTETHDVFLDEDHGPVLDHHIWYINTVGLQPSIIDSIAVFKYKKDDGVIEGTECSVCLTEFEEEERLRLLPKCSHAFHIPCIDTWLRSHTNCPMCRAPLVSANNGPSSSSIVTEVSEETLVPIPEDDEESEGGSGTSHEDESAAVENEGNSGVVQLEPIRRSVSLDSMAASRISEFIAGGSNSYNESKESSLRIVPKRVTGNHQSLLRLMSIGRSLQIRPIFMKRSFSCNGKFSLPINRNRNPAMRSF